MAELVQKYQDFLPAQGVHDLAKTAFPPRPLVSESEQEDVSPAPRRHVRNKSRHRPLPRNGSVSDFEQSYAANIAPRYLTHSRKILGVSRGSRIPAPIVPALQSQSSSRRQSPDKRSSSGRGKEVRFSRPSSPSNVRNVSFGGRPTKQRISSRPKEKTFSRPSSSSGSKSTFRKAPSGPLVSNITKHFERLGRDAERLKSRYSVIRGKRARPVASARARVEVLDSVKDAIKDESDSSDSSSEADDEDEGVDEERVVPKLIAPSSPEADPTSPEVAIKTAPPGVASFSDVVSDPETQETEAPLPCPISMPPSPFLSSTKNDISVTPPTPDLELAASGAERPSILKAISGFWLQPPPTSRLTDDPMSDPEHIFRDSSMVVRTDEPTSIIALALKYLSSFYALIRCADIPFHSSPQYRDMLAKSRAEKRTAREAKLNESGEAFMPDDRSVAESTSTWGVVNVDPGEAGDPTEDLKAPSSKLPWAICKSLLPNYIPFISFKSKTFLKRLRVVD